jgi:hypothetical protein
VVSDGNWICSSLDKSFFLKEFYKNTKFVSFCVNQMPSCRVFCHTEALHAPQIRQRQIRGVMKMIYEILIRPSYNKKMTSDHLIWVESDLPTRAFEQWLRDNALLDGTVRSPLVRWSIIQSKCPAHFVLATQEDALTDRISELMSGATHLVDMPIIARQTAAGKAMVNA